MAVASLLFSLMATCVRYASDLPATALSFYRFGFGVVVVLGLALAGRARLRTRNWQFLFARGLLGGIAVYLYYVAICKVGLAKGTVLSYTFPVFVPLFGVVLLKERVPVNIAACIPIAFAGVYLIVSPERLTEVTRYDLAAILCALCSAAAVVCIKRLRETDAPYVIFLSQSAFGVAMVSYPALRAGLSVPISLLPALLGIGLFAVAAQLLMTYSYKLVPATSGSLMGYLTPVFNVLIGVLAFGEKLGAHGMIGCVIVLGVSLYITLAGREA